MIEIIYITLKDVPKSKIHINDKRKMIINDEIEYHSDNWTNLIMFGIKKCPREASKIPVMGYN